MAAMNLYRDLYYKLFAATADAIEALEKQDTQLARQILIAAEQAAEEAVIAEDTASEK